MRSPQRRNVVIVAENELSREGLRSMLGRSELFRVIEVCGNPEAACRAMETQQPNVVLIDLEGSSFAAESAWSCIHEVSPETHVVFVLPRTNGHALPEALRIPAHGYVTAEELTAEALPEALTAAVQGRAVIRVSDVQRALLANGDEPNGSGLLTARELEVLDLVASGCRDTEIAQRLTLSVSTIRKHVRQSVLKLEAATRPEAVARAVRKGYI